MGGYATTAQETGERLSVRGGELRYEDGMRVKVSVGQFVHVGCHSLTWEAWNLLKELVEKGKR